MKKEWLLYLLTLLFFCACSDDKSDTPQLELNGIFLNGGNEDYSQKMDELLPLRAGDFLTVFFVLDGNGTDLKSFMAKNESDNIQVMFTYMDDKKISDDFTDLSKGILYYKDGVETTDVAVELKVLKAKKEDYDVSFYLNSKAPDCEGASYHLGFAATTEPRDE